MKKIKLNIQMFASTNKTTNYELPQFVGTDKPSWLGDFNEAMLTIDTGMHDNATAIDGVESASKTATSTANQALQSVSSLSNTVSSQGSSITTINSTLTTQGTAISSIDGRVTTLETDNTTNKSDITDLKSITQALSSYINLNHNESFNKSNAIKFPNNSPSFINVASNEDGSVCKIYGFLAVDSISGNTYAEVQTRLRPSEDITINSLEIIGYQGGNSTWYGNVIIRKTGKVEFRVQALGTNSCNVIVVPCLLFLTNFGDVDE